MDGKEDGEISDDHGDSFDLSYRPVVRPDVSQYRCVPRHLPSSDEDYSSDSDSDMTIVKKKKPNVSKMDTGPPDSRPHKGWPPDSLEAIKAFAKPKQRNNIWSTVMEEQVLSQEIGGFGLKRRLDKGDRSVESYDYAQARKVRDMLEGSDEEEEEGKETDDIKKKRLNRKRPAKDRLVYTKRVEEDHPRELHDVTLTEEMTDEDVGTALADALFETKPDIIVRVVDVLGREKSLQLFKETQELERSGGLMVLDGSRRRTSGGVYLQLLKKLPGVEKSDLNKIFVQEGEWRKRKRAHRRRERHESKPQVKMNKSSCINMRERGNYKSGRMNRATIHETVHEEIHEAVHEEIHEAVHEAMGEDGTEEGLHLGGLFSDDPGGAKCPGSTPVTSPQPSDNEDDLPSSTINQLSPSVMPEQLPTPPPSVADPRAFKPEVLETINGDFLRVEAPPLVNADVDPRAAKTEAYDEEFLLDNHAADEMELF